MAIRFQDLLKHPVEATDGEIGSIDDVLFDDRTWLVRYLSLSTSRWLPGKKVVLPPEVLAKKEDGDRSPLKVSLSKEEIKSGPLLDEHLPVTRQHQLFLHRHYSWEPYWSSTLPVGLAPYSWSHVTDHFPVAPKEPEWISIQRERDAKFEGHLHSLRKLVGYGIGTDDDKTFGEIDDFIIEEKSWRIIDLIINSRKWIPGGKQFVSSPFFCTSIDQNKRFFHLSQSKDTILDGPAFDFAEYGDAFRTRLLDYYRSRATSSDSVGTVKRPRPEKTVSGPEA